MEQDIEQLKEQFLLRYNPNRMIELALTSGVKAAVQRNILYSPTLPQRERNMIVKFWKKELMNIYYEYIQIEAMNDELYEQFIMNLKNRMNERYNFAFIHNKIGYDNGFRISHAQKSISVFIKHLWCMNLIKLPLQCPVDRIILTIIGYVYPDNKWGYINSIEIHREKIKFIREHCNPQDIAVWELGAF